MNKKIRNLLLAMTIAVPSFVFAAEKENITLNDVPKVAPEEQHPTSCKRVYRLLTENHYRKDIAIDDKFVREFYLKLFEYVDGYKALFYKSEIDEFLSDIGNARSSIVRCKLDLPFKIFNQYAVHRFEQINNAIELLKIGNLDLTKDENFVYDRKNSEWPSEPQERKELWEKIVKYDLIKIMLSGKDREQATKQLVKRYKSNLNFLTQIRSEDAFSAFESVLSHRFDPHTNYMSPIASEEFYTDMHLSLEGIGATLRSEDDTVTIEELIPGGPAEKSKLLKPKDRIIGVGSAENKLTDLVGMRLDEAVKLIRGPKGSKVYLQIQRGEGEAVKIFVISLIRDKIKLTDRAASSEVLDFNGRKVGVLKVSSFYDNLTKDARKEIENMKAKGIDALVVDLRDNGGGLINEAAGFTGLFVKNGPVVQVRDMDNYVESVDDPSSDIMYEGPMVVLINNFSASASEIFSAALQDYGRAVITGSNSFGKGTVQQVMPLGKFYDLFSKDLGQLSYTIAKFYRINGGSTQLKGVKPDVSMPTLSEVQKIAESEYENALPWDSITSRKYNTVYSLSGYFAELQKRVNERIEKNRAYQITLEQIAEARELMDKDSVSLNFDVRSAKQKEDSKKELSRTNELLAMVGVDPVENVSDIPADVKLPDVQKEQASLMALDLADMMK